MRPIAAFYGITAKGAQQQRDNKSLNRRSPSTNLSPPAGASQAAFGDAVFHDRLQEGDLVGAARARYREFVGNLREQYGEATGLVFLMD
jgi:hypothetical protein